VKFLKNNEGVSVCSKILATHLDNKTNPSKREMAAMQQALKNSAAIGIEFAQDCCPAGGDPSWLVAREKRDALELENEAPLPQKTRQRSPTAPFLNELLDINKENIPFVQLQQCAKSTRPTTKSNCLSPSLEEPEHPTPTNGEMLWWRPIAHWTYSRRGY